MHVHKEVFAIKSMEGKKRCSQRYGPLSKRMNIQRFKENVVLFLCELYSTYDPIITDSVSALSVMLPSTIYSTFSNI